MSRIILLILVSFPLVATATATPVSDKKQTLASKSGDHFKQSIATLKQQSRTIKGAGHSLFENTDFLSLFNATEDSVSLKTLNNIIKSIQATRQDKNDSVKKISNEGLKLLQQDTLNLDAYHSADEMLVPTPVPEPFSLFLIVLGLFLVWLSDQRDGKNKK